jgi:hypothetical protein
MKRGKDLRSARGELVERNAANEIAALMFVLVEQSPGAFTLRFVANDELIEDLSKQGALQVFLDDVDRLYADFRKRFPDAPIMTRPD